MNDFDYLAQLPGEEREQDWIRKRLGTLSVREGYALTAAVMEILENLHFDGCGQDDHSAIAKYYQKLTGTVIE